MIPVYVRRPMSGLHVGMLWTCWLGNVVGYLFAGHEIQSIWLGLGMLVIFLHYETRDVQIGTVGEEHAP